MAVVHNYLNFEQETNVVPCQLRAKHSFATHPRSIDESVRRTKISDNIKKLQGLFPNMDKKTPTAGMLDMSVEYIKDLHNQVQSVKMECNRDEDVKAMDLAEKKLLEKYIVGAQMFASKAESLYPKLKGLPQTP